MRHKHTIDLWQVGELPELARKLDALIPYNLRIALDAFEYGENTITVEDIGTLAGVELAWIGTKWSCDPHTDPTVPKWTHLLVVKNPTPEWGGFYVGSISRKSQIRHQPVGTVLSLDVHKTHWLAANCNGPMDDPRWVALMFTSRRRVSPKRVLATFKRAAEALIAEATPHAV